MTSSISLSLQQKQVRNRLGDYCPLLHLVTLIATFESKRIPSLQTKIEKAFSKLSECNLQQVSESSFDALIKMYDQYLRNTQNGKQLLQLLLQKINKNSRPLITIELLEVLASQRHAQMQLGAQTQLLYEAFQIGLLLKVKSFKTFNFAVRACQMMCLKQFEKKCNSVITALRHQINSHTQSLLNNISQASKVYGIKIKPKKQRQSSQKQNKQEYLKHVFQRSSSKGRKFSQHNSSREQIVINFGFKQGSAYKPNVLSPNKHSNNPTSPKNDPYVRQSINEKRKSQNEDVYEQQMMISKYFSSANNEIYSKIKRKIKSKPQLLPFHILLYEMYSICILRSISEIKKKYFKDFRTQLKQKIIRQYPGRNIQQVLFDLQLEKLKFHQAKIDAKWKEKPLSTSTLIKKGRNIQKPHQKPNHNSSVIQQTKEPQQTIKYTGQQINEFERSTDSMIMTKSGQIHGLRMKKSCHQFHTQPQKPINHALQKCNQKKLSPHHEIKQEHEPININIRTRMISSKSEHKLVTKKQISQHNPQQNNCTEVPNPRNKMKLQLSTNQQNKQMHRPSSRHKDQQNKTKPNIFQRIKQTDGKDKPTLRKKAKPLIQEKNFIKLACNHNKKLDGDCGLGQQQIKSKEKERRQLGEKKDYNKEQKGQKESVDVQIQQEEDEQIFVENSTRVNEKCEQKPETNVQVDRELQSYPQMSDPHVNQFKPQHSTLLNEDQKPHLHQKQQHQQDQLDIDKSSLNESQLDLLLHHYLQLQLQLAPRLISQIMLEEHIDQSNQAQNDQGHLPAQYEQQSHLITSIGCHSSEQYPRNNTIAQLPLSPFIQTDNHQKVLFPTPQPSIQIVIHSQSHGSLEESHQSVQESSLLNEMSKPQREEKQNQIQPNQMSIICCSQSEKNTLSQRSQHSSTVRSNFGQSKPEVSHSYQKHHETSDVNFKSNLLQIPNKDNEQNNNNDLEQLLDKTNELNIQLLEQIIQSQNLAITQSNIQYLLYHEQTKSYLAQLYQTQTNPDNYDPDAVSKSNPRLPQTVQQQLHCSQQRFQQDSSNDQLQGLHSSAHDISFIAHEYISQFGQDTSLISIALLPHHHPIQQPYHSQNHTCQNINHNQTIEKPQKTDLSQSVLLSPESFQQNSSPLNQIPNLHEVQVQLSKFCNHQQVDCNSQQSEKPQLGSPPLLHQPKQTSPQSIPQTQNNIRSSIQDSLLEMASLIKNSLVNSNNIFGQSINNPTRKSIIKSDSKIKIKSAINQNKDSNSNKQADRERNLSFNEKPKTVQISIAPRQEDISSSQQLQSIVISHHLLKPQIKISESMVTLSVFHPCQKSSCQVEREFSRPINIKDYTKGLQLRVTKFLDSLINQSTAMNATPSSHHTEHSAKLKTTKQKKSSFQKHYMTQFSVKSLPLVNWEYIVQNISAINLEPQLINLKNLKIQFKKEEFLTVCLMHYIEYNRIIVQYKKNPLELRPVQISVDLNESIEEVRTLFNEKNVKIELVDINNKIQVTLQVYNLWCHLETLAISLKNSTSKLKSIFKLNQFVFKNKQGATKYNMLIAMVQSEGEKLNLIISDLSMEDRNKLLNNFSIVVGYAVKIDNSKSKFIVSGKQIKQFLKML